MKRKVTHLDNRRFRAGLDAPPEPDPPDSQQFLENDICIHILTVSAAMVGVCLTVIGLFKVIAELKSFSTVGDNLLAVDSLAFLASCILSYASLRSRRKARKVFIGRVADVTFLGALIVMVITCGLIAYAFI